jgi:DNA topoisomerase I
LKENQMKTLVIVESPSKAKTIQGYLGKDYKVVASKGHICDLGKGSKHGIGVEVENNFKPHYVIIDDQVGTVDMLMREAEQVDQILLAPDNDREGESIAWHLADRLIDMKRPIKRIGFHEITKKAILEAIKNPRDINMPLFKSQEARRILDRLVGFMASPFLMNFFGAGLSAGRVQSVVTKMVVDKEREIEAFVPEEYWVIQASLANKANEHFTAKYEPKVKDAATASKIKTELEKDTFVVLDVNASEEKKKPQPPLITAKLQQIMSKGYSISPDRTMKAAQSLYEAGYITYMRTDSIRINPDALKNAREWLKTNKYDIPKTANVFKNKNAAQDAHECIRPTDLSMEPNNFTFSNSDEKVVYDVIWKYFLASQMMPAIYDTLKVSIQAKSNKKHILKASGKALRSEGYLAILGVVDKSSIDIPNLQVGEELSLAGKNPITAEQKYTQPPARFSEANLIKHLEEKEIGRPATFSELLSKISARNYVEKRGNVFHPTELGKQITDELSKFFSFMNENYTAEMETKLDLIETGATDQLKMLQEFFEPFKQELNKAYVSHGAEICAKCQSPMALKKANNGNQFWSCINWPRCRFSKNYVVSAA